MKTTLRFIMIVFATVVGLRAIGEPSWHFEFSGGIPVKLVWQAQPGETSYLRESTNLLSWSQVAGFPKVAEGTVMEYAFTPGAQRFFEIGKAEARSGGWQQMAVPALAAGEWYEFAAVSALNPLQVWIAGSVRPMHDSCVLRSENGGGAWAQVYREANAGFFGDLQMVSAETGYVAGGCLRRTTDGGTTWPFDQGNLPDPPGTWHNVGPDGYVYGMAVVSADELWTAGYDGASAGVIYHRVPGRSQTNPVNSNTPWWLEWAQERTGMYGVSAATPTIAWAVGYGGNIWRTTDGQSWGQQVSPTPSALQDVVAVDTNTVWAVGDGGTIVKTTNAGALWLPQVSGTTEGLRRIAAVNSNVAWAVGSAGVILHTSDGGASWQRQFSGTTAALLGVAAVDSQTAWVVGGENVILRTTDGGAGAWPTPAISGVSPNVVGASSWPLITLTVSGTGFRGGNLSAKIGNEPVADVVWLSESTVQVVAPWLPAGTYDLTLVNEDGQQATLPRGIIVMPEPLAARFSPWHGMAAGGYQITIDGYNLRTVTDAILHLSGADPETLPFNVVDSTRVLVTLPASATRLVGQATLELRTAQQQSAVVSDFLLDASSEPAFAINSITPASGPSLTEVTVSGIGFSTNATLEICDRNVILTSRSTTELVGKVFGNQWGIGRLVLMNNESEDISIDPAFLLIEGPVPTLTLVTPNSASSAGGATVTLVGTGFVTTDTVTFDGYPAEVTSRTSSSMVVKIPTHAPGVVSVFVMTDGLERGAAELPGGFTYH